MVIVMAMAIHTLPKPMATPVAVITTTATTTITTALLNHGGAHANKSLPNLPIQNTT